MHFVRETGIMEKVEIKATPKDNKSKIRTKGWAYKYFLSYQSRMALIPGWTLRDVSRTLGGGLLDAPLVVRMA